MLEKTEQKWINLVLADLYERAVRYRKNLMSAKPMSNREKAIWRALAQDAIEAYNHALRNMRGVVSSKLAQEAEFLTPAKIDKQYTWLDAEDIEEIICSTFYISQLERKNAAEEAKNELHKQFQNNPELLIEAKNILIGMKQISEHRGNPAKGGFTKALIAQGHSHSEALNLAEEKVTDLSIQDVMEADKYDPKVQAAINLVYPEYARKKMTDNEKGEELLRMLKGEKTSLKPKFEREEDDSFFDK